jgi:hypothetical protein
MSRDNLLNVELEVLAAGILTSWVTSTWLPGEMPKETRSECFYCWKPLDENGHCEHSKNCIVTLAAKIASADGIQVIDAKCALAKVVNLIPTNDVTGVGKWCAPGPSDQQIRKWLLMFDDADMRSSIYDDEKEARNAFKNAEGKGYNCHLFMHAPRVEHNMEIR